MIYVRPREKEASVNSRRTILCLLPCKLIGIIHSADYKRVNTRFTSTQIISTLTDGGGHATPRLQGGQGGLFKSQNDSGKLRGSTGMKTHTRLAVWLSGLSREGGGGAADHPRRFRPIGCSLGKWTRLFTPDPRRENSSGGTRIFGPSATRAPHEESTFPQRRGLSQSTATRRGNNRCNYPGSVKQRESWLHKERERHMSLSTMTHHVSPKSHSLNYFIRIDFKQKHHLARFFHFKIWFRVFQTNCRNRQVFLPQTSKVANEEWRGLFKIKWKNNKIIYKLISNHEIYNISIYLFISIYLS